LTSSSSALAQGEKDEKNGGLTRGDAAILRFLAAAEILESDLWLQYQELAGTQDNEVSTLASQLIPGYPSQPTGGSPAYNNAISQLDSDMAQYIHDNTEDELSHEVFINAYLASKGADAVNLDQFRTLPSSKATGANQFGWLKSRAYGGSFLLGGMLRLSDAQYHAALSEHHCLSVLRSSQQPRLSSTLGLRNRSSLAGELFDKASGRVFPTTTLPAQPVSGSGPSQRGS
jgi:hypothetical protein